MRKDGHAKFRKTARKTLNKVLGLAGFQVLRHGEKAHIKPVQPFRITLKDATKARAVGKRRKSLRRFGLRCTQSSRKQG